MIYKDGMEFATEEEAEEYFGEYSYGYYTNSSFVQKPRYKENISYKNNNYYVDEPKNCAVMAYVSGGCLYVSDFGGITYNITEAKHFTKKEAKEKAKYMSKKGSYNWEWVMI